MGSIKGSKPSGTTTVNQVNPLQVAQQPFLQRGWQQASDLFTAYPNAFVPTAGEPITLSALQQLQQTGANLGPMLGQANQFWQTGGQGNIQNSPAYQYYQNLAQGTTGPQGMLTGAGQSAQGYGQAAAGGNLGLSTLGNIAGGQYLNSNPYTAAMVQSAIDPVIRNYQTAIAPNIDATFEQAGRYMSPSMRNAQSSAQQNLLKGIGDISSNIYGTQFANERALQNQAAQQYGLLSNQGQAIGIQGANTAIDAAYRNLVGQQAGAAGLQGGYQAGNAAALDAARLYPGLAQAQMIGPQTQLAAGTGFNEWQRQYLDSPYKALERYQSEVGSPLTGTQSTTSPYFQNQLANTLGGIAGGLGIANQANNLGLFGSGGLGGLFGAGGSTLVEGAPGVLSGSAASDLIGAGLATDASGGVGLELLASAAPAEAAAKAAPLAIGSDRRLKEDIIRIGELDNGLPVYLFKYKGDPTQRVGLMADEVEKVVPEAVGRRSDGYKTVDYHHVMRTMLRR